ncbi:MAG: transposase [Pseudobdellovibrionaceae bacterium]|nr:transposase [Pseudobdellovibrionaceae bacterium]
MPDQDIPKSARRGASLVPEDQASVQAQLTALTRAVAALHADNAALKADNAALRHHLEAAERGREAAERGREAAESTCKSLKSELEGTKSELKKAKKRTAKLEAYTAKLEGDLEEVKNNLAAVTQELRKAHGHDPSSEKGTTLCPENVTTDEEPSDASTPPPASNPKRSLKNKDRYKQSGLAERFWRRLQREAERVKGFISKKMLRSKWLRNNGSNAGLIPACESPMPCGLIATESNMEERKVTLDQRKEHFNKHTGLSSSLDRPSRWDFQIRVTKLTCVHETLTDPASGKSFRAGELDFGPKGYKITWRALTNIILMVAEHAIPIERIGRLLGIPYFSSANICRWLQMAAEHCLPIYIAMFKELAKCSHLRMDDTSTLVLAMRKKAKAAKTFKADADISGDEFEDGLDEIEAECENKGRANLVAPLARIMGRVAQYALGEGGKKGVNLTVVSGQVDSSDSRSTIFFFRTHFGQAGNLVSRVLEQRTNRETFKVFIQSDRSNQNNLEKSVASLVDVTYVGCYAHARRPFAKHVNDDEELCYYLLRAFLLIAHCEEAAFAEDITSERILRYRRKERFIWAIIRDVCEHVVGGKKHHFAKNKIWKSKTHLYKAAKYVLDHFNELTVYLDYPYLFAENNAIERSLRIEKAIQDAAKFRNAEEGRIALDVIRSVISTCRAAEVDFEWFLTEVLKTNRETIAKNPADYLPIVFSQAKP